MNFKKIIIVFLVGSLCLFFGTSTSEAYVKEGWRLPSKSATFKWGSRLQVSGSVIRNGWEAARVSWGNASKFSFNVNSSSASELNSWYESSTTKYGRMTTSYNTSTMKVTKFVGEVNAGNSDNSKTNVAKSVCVHEFGHAIGIGHNNGTSIMNSKRDRAKMHVPQPDDKNGVNAIYK